MEFGNNLKYLRTLRNETQTDIAKLVNKDRSLVSKWENNEKEPTIEDLITIAEHYSFSISELCKTNIVLNKSDYNVNLDENHKLDAIVGEKAKKLSVEDKKWIIKTMDMILNTRDKDKK